MYGFNLGVISGLSRDIPVLNITLNNGTSNTYTVLYYDGIWRDDVEEPTIVLGVSEETNECSVVLTTLTSESVGDEYTINLSLPEAPTQAFKEAVGMATEALVFTMPSEFNSLLESALASALPSVIAADGKPCLVSGITWTENDAIDTDAFYNFYDNVTKAAQNLNTIAYIVGEAITSRYYNEGSLSAHIEWTQQMISTEISTDTYYFNIGYTVNAHPEGNAHIKTIDCLINGVALTHIT